MTRGPLAMIVMAVCTAWQPLFAGNEQWIVSARGSDIVDAELEIRDPLLDYVDLYWTGAAYQQRFRYKISRVQVRLRLDGTDPQVLPDGTLEVEYDLQFREFNSSAIGTPISGATLQVGYDGSGPHDDLAISFVDGAIWAALEVTNVQLGGGFTSIPTDAYLDLLLEVERVYVLDDAPPEQAEIIDQEYDATNEFMTVRWDHVEGAVSYDLAWLFIDIPTGNGLGMSFDMDNATIVNTPAHEYRIPLSYPRGTVLFRIRPIGEDVTTFARTEGSWFGPGSASVLGTQILSICRFDYDGLEIGRNWTYTGSYAERGLRKDLLTYFDGGLKSRQSLTLLSTDGNSLIGEDVYDYLGRPALQLLPYPIVGQSLKFKVDQLLQGVGDYYDHEDFDQDGNTEDPVALDGALPAGAYWDVNTSPIGNLGAYAPQAGGFPFSRTLYKNDGTGRVKAQYGPGYAMIPHGTSEPGHGTHYEYGKPGTQEELDRLFGNEVGDVSHYKKTLVTDPNGVVSVIYQDAAGRTIATALAGEPDPDGALEAIDTYPGAGQQLNGALPSQMIGGEYVTNHPVPLPNQTALEFSYSLDGASYFECVTGVCKYDLTITILDACGNTVTMAGAQSNPIVLTGITEQTPALTFSTVQLDPGVYTIIKVLKLHEPALTQYLADFADEFDNCFQLPEPPETSCDCETQCELTYIYYDADGVPHGLDDDGNTISVQDAIDNFITPCQEECDLEIVQPDPCEARRQQLIIDMSPGGQYFDNAPPLALINGTYVLADRNNWLMANVDNDPNNVLPGLSGLNLTDWDDVRDHWDPVWADDLIEYHPEYCLYLFYCYPTCSVGEDPAASFYGGYYLDLVNTPYVSLANSSDPNHDLFNPVDLTYSVASSPPPEDPNTYQPINGPGYDLDPYMVDCWLYHGEIPSGCPLPMSMGEYLMKFLPLTSTDYASLYYVLADPDGLGGTPPTSWYQGAQDLWVMLHDATNGILEDSSTPQSGHLTPWQLFRVVYLFYRDYVAYTLYDNYSDCGVNLTCHEARLTSSNGTQFDDDGFLIHYPANPIYDNFASFLADPNNIATLMDDMGNDGCEDQCSVLVAQWMTQLEGCLHSPGAYGYSGPNAATDLATDLEAALLNFCVEECGDAGGTTLGTNPFVLNNSSSTQLNSLDGALTYFYGSDYADDCGDIILPWEAELSEECACSNLLYFLQSLEADGIIDLSDGFSDQEAMDAADEIEDLLAANETVAWQDLVSWYEDCDENTPIDGTTGLPSIFACTDLPEDDYDCESEADALNTTNAALMYIQALTAAVNSFAANYRTACMADLNVREHFTMNYTLNEYHYTLYYYDQAGNLVKTVPPEGVFDYDQQQWIDLQRWDSGTSQWVDETDLSAVQAHRDDPDNEPFIRRNTSFATVNTYNSWQEVRRSHTPNGGDGEYWYDPIGRLVASQNAEQLGSQDFSYSLYDELGRVVESGQATSPATPDPITDDIVRLIDATYPDGVPELVANTASTLTQVTHTYYNSVAAVGGLSTILGSDRNLRNRVGYVTYQEDLGSSTYDHATHYAYDVHGNVRDMVQDLPELEGIDQRLKHIHYEYDLVSGNVKALDYQPGEWDQFHHRYRYDADNRLLEAQTSRDGIIWERDARYFYCAHGPLARTELGDKQVQGIDYVYTLQGWLKAMNSPIMQPAYDPGQDGNMALSTELDKYFPPDLSALGLGYFPDDYAPVLSTTPDVVPTTSGTGLHQDFEDRALYNGNIPLLYSAIPDQYGAPLSLHAKLYTYDQLNRIKVSTVYDATAQSTSLSNLAAGSAYGTNYVYDGNGNIERLNRYAYGAAPHMDDLTYHYTAGSDQLLQVTDQIPYNLWTDDIDDQSSSSNYAYDDRGQLTQDLSALIGAITWDLAGKVRRVERSGTALPGGGYPPDLEFAYGADRQRVRKTVKPWTTSGSLKNEEDWESTYYIRDAQGNPLAIYQRTYDQVTTGNFNETFALEEWPVFGSARLGSARETRSYSNSFSFTGSVYVNGPTTAGSQTEQLFNIPPNYGSMPSATGVVYEPLVRTRGQKSYELTDHLGNVKTTVSDRRTAEANGGGGFDHFAAVVLTAQDYYPFGSLLLNRTVDPDAYRFAFQGQEKDDEIHNATGTSYAFEYRIHDPRIGRFTSIDPLAMKYPDISPYAGLGNSPIWLKDADGRVLTLYYTDENGNKQKIKIRTAEDVKALESIQNEFVQDFVRALDHVQQYNADKGIVNSLIESRKNFKVKSNSENRNPNFNRGSSYDWRKRTIFWNNEAGGAYMTNGEPQNNSPAFILLSEIGKAYYTGVEGYKIPKFYGLTSPEGLEVNGIRIGVSMQKQLAALRELEGKVAREVEFDAANALNVNGGYHEGYRREWTPGCFYNTEDVNCTEPKDENEQRKVERWQNGKVDF